MTYIDLTKPPEVYIVCEDRQKHRINVKVCEKRCKNKCRAYREWRAKCA